MPFSFLPRMIYPHLTDVRAEDLTARGVSFLMLDFDNTIVPYTTNEPTPEMATSPASPAHCGAVSGGTTWPEASVTLVEMVCTPFSSA